MDKVIVAMSGGVDSSVAAAYLKEQGYKVIGLTFIMFSKNKTMDYKDKKAVEDAKSVANQIGIEHYTENITEDFHNEVIQDFIDQYKNARTPNPCVICNRKIKFDYLLKNTKELNADFMATGHYARIEEQENNRILLKKAIDKNKDQSYMLYRMSQKQLEHTIFPMGKFEKEKIREMAKKYKLKIHDKPDSQDICFIKNSNYIDFLENQSDDIGKPGPIIDINGNKLGEHNGLHNYTIGQRRGLGISKPYPLYVVDLDSENNTVVVGKNENVFSNSFYIENSNWIYYSELRKPIVVNCKIRYNSPEKLATVYPEENDLFKVVFKDEQRAITPGQSAVFYKNDYVLGGGIIK
ncbi:MAG: tRNA 2-thiouridine(34) synthase MnmA [Halanaerobiales bacterium]|nr:tRNA 2-thiouridine(34) synthase MnmA [Halanaerobiales bacterium]